NYRLQGMQAAVLAVKLKYLDGWNDARRAHAARYRELLADTWLELPVEMPWSRHVYHLFVVRVKKNREVLVPRMTAKEIDTGIHYPIPIHLQPAYADLGYRAGDFPHAEQAAAEVYSLPIYPEMDEAKLSRVASALRESLAEKM